MEDLALELAKKLHLDADPVDNWDEIPEDHRIFMVHIAKTAINFLKSKGFRQVLEAEIPFQENYFVKLIIDANPGGLWTEVK